MGKSCAVALIAPLFVPAIRPDRFAKAAVSGADAIIVDLEDAVAPVDKLDARKSLSALAGVEARTFVRINAQATPWFDGDMRELQARQPLARVASSRIHSVFRLVSRSTRRTVKVDVVHRPNPSTLPQIFTGRMEPIKRDMR